VYNAHNLYGMTETLATADALQRLRNKRQFILTRCALVSFCPDLLSGMRCLQAMRLAAGCCLHALLAGCANLLAAGMLAGCADLLAACMRAD
jgi:hypothetical protein